MDQNETEMKEPVVADWLTPVEAAEYAGLSKPRIYAMIKDMVVVTRDVPPDEREHRGPTVMVNKDSLDTYLANRDRPRDARKVTSTKYVREGTKVVVEDNELQQILHVPLKELIAAYKERRIDQTVYTIREAARVTGLEQRFVKKMCEIGMIECETDGRGNFTIPEREVSRIKAGN